MSRRSYDEHRNHASPDPLPEPGDRVEVLPTGDVGTVEHVEPRNEVTGYVYIRLRMDDFPWPLVQPSISVRRLPKDRRS